VRLNRRRRRAAFVPAGGHAPREPDGEGAGEDAAHGAARGAAAERAGLRAARGEAAALGSGAWLGAADAAALGLQAIGEVSERDGRGKHTTRHVSLLQARAPPRARRPDTARSLLLCTSCQAADTCPLPSLAF